MTLNSASPETKIHVNITQLAAFSLEYMVLVWEEEREKWRQADVWNNKSESVKQVVSVDKWRNYWNHIFLSDKQS